MEEIDLMLYLISLLLGGVGAWIILKWGFKLSLIDKPNLRSSHETVTPKGGGIGILAAFFVCSIACQFQKAFGFRRFFYLYSVFGEIVQRSDQKCVCCFSLLQEQFY